MAFYITLQSAMSQDIVTTVSRCKGAVTFVPWLSEFSGVVLSCFTLSRSTIFTDVSLEKPEDSFKAILYSVSWVRTHVG